MKVVFSVLLVSLMIVCAFTFSSDNGTKDLSKKNTSFSTKTVVVKGPALDQPLTILNESFESTTFPPTGWIKLSPDGGTGWESITAGTTPLPGWNGGVATVPTGGGSKTAYASWGTGGATANDQWLVSPQLTNVQANDSLKLWLRKPGYTNGYMDHFDIKISTTTPTVAGFTVTVVALTHPANSPDTNWMELKYRLGNFVTTGANIYIGFREWVLDNYNDGAAYQLDLVRTTSMTGVSTISSNVPDKYNLSQNYPNPFNPVTKINFDIPKSGFVSLKVYDVLGKEVATILNEVKNAGSYSADFSGASLSNGVYFYRLESNGFVSTKKMMLVK
jgi:hypothetical protein